jgi:hypothetical protein
MSCELHRKEVESWILDLHDRKLMLEEAGFFLKITINEDVKTFRRRLFK